MVIVAIQFPPCLLKKGILTIPVYSHKRQGVFFTINPPCVYIMAVVIASAGFPAPESAWSPGFTEQVCLFSQWLAQDTQCKAPGSDPLRIHRKDMKGIQHLKSYIQYNRPLSLSLSHVTYRYDTTKSLPTHLSDMEVLACTQSRANYYGALNVM